MIDVFGQMWGTMLINCMTALCTLTGVAGVCIRERLAIGVVSSPLLLDFLFLCMGSLVSLWCLDVAEHMHCVGCAYIFLMCYLI